MMNTLKGRIVYHLPRLAGILICQTDPRRGIGIGGKCFASFHLASCGSIACNNDGAIIDDTRTGDNLLTRVAERDI